VQKILKMGERYQIKWLGSYVRGESVWDLMKF
jgi:hypothetical protein